MTPEERAEQDRIERARYLAAVNAAPVGLVASWLTSVCPECEHGFWEAEFIHSDHAMIGANVIIACEGYWVINPNVVGYDREQWTDWRHDAFELGGE